VPAFLLWRTSMPSEAGGACGGCVCPSARCRDGAILLGIVNADATIGYLRPLTVIDSAFVEAARRGRTPETRFRFADRCIEGACQQWAGERCSVIDRAFDARDAEQLAPIVRFPLCAIRPKCRWYAQAGADACTVCPMILTEHDSAQAESPVQLAQGGGPAE
jgi:hypothetical protein